MIVNYNSRVIPVAWITSVEGDEQPNWGPVRKLFCP